MMKRELILKWLDQALAQDLHTKIFIPAEFKDDVRKLKTAFMKEVEVLYQIDPERASTLLVGYTRKDQRWWIVIERVIGNVLVGFVKLPDGTVKRIQVTDDSERERRIALMAEDGYTLWEIEESEGPLTDLEKAMIGEKDENACDIRSESRTQGEWEDI